MSVKLNQLFLSNIRNIAAADVKLGKNFNIFVGLNGSGKTSLLEAIHLLSVGRSFRARSPQQIISFGAQHCLVRGKVLAESDQSSEDVWLAVEKGCDGSSSYKLGEKLEKSVSELSRALPVQVIDVNSHLLIEGGPIYRRKFIDWGVFHVEHDFLQHWRSMQRALDQRNSCLKNRNIPPAVWDETFVKYARLVTAARHTYVNKLAEVFRPLVKEMLNLTDVSLVYRCGWEDGRDLSEQLLERAHADLACGFTTCGPQRAELDILVNGRSAQQVLSRGQIKIFVCNLLLARSMLLKQPRSNVFLIDDLHAELDQENCQRLVAAINDLDCQVFITGIEENLLTSSLQGFASNMFHMEHGVIV